MSSISSLYELYRRGTKAGLDALPVALADLVIDYAADQLAFFEDVWCRLPAMRTWDLGWNYGGSLIVSIVASSTRAGLAQLDTHMKTYPLATINQRSSHTMPSTAAMANLCDAMKCHGDYSSDYAYTFGWPYKGIASAVNTQFENAARSYCSRRPERDCLCRVS